MLEIIDAQTHVWEHDHQTRPWSSAPPSPTAEPSPFFSGTSVVTDVDMLARMQELGVARAILVTSTRHYGTDNSYALESAARHPDHFRVVIRVDPGSPRLPEDVARAKADPLVAGVRILTISPSDQQRFREGRFDRLFALAERASIPVCVYPVSTMPLLTGVVRRFPELSVVIDHLGLAQRPVARRGDLFADLPQLIGLADFPNVTVKLSGVATLSWQSFPFADVWPHIHRVIEAFGPERLMWGSDATRAEGIVDYREGLHWLIESGELSRGDLGLVLGGTLRRVFGWVD